VYPVPLAVTLIPVIAPVVVETVAVASAPAPSPVITTCTSPEV